MRPSRITTTRSASANASPWSCVTASTVVPNWPNSARSSTHQTFAQSAVELAERLVQHQQTGRGRQRAGQRDALLLTAGQRGDRPLPGVRQPHQLQQLTHPARLFTARGAPHAQPERHVACDVALREELVVLEHQAEPASVRGHPGLVGSCEQHPPAVGGLEARDDPQQCRLAAAAGPEQAHRLVLGDLQVDPVERGALSEPYAHTVELQHHSSPLRSVRRRSRTSSATAHTTIKIVLRAIAWP